MATEKDKTETKSSSTKPKAKPAKTTKAKYDSVKKFEPIKKPYKNPTETWWGKLIVWIIIFGMVGLVILSFVLALLTGNA